MLSVSVVINTYNRCRTLRDALSSLQQVNYPRFEVVVVNGPSTDETEAVLAEYGPAVKVLRCPVRNLSVSRNIGICGASGDVIAFMDDDAVADARWLDALVAAYDDPAVGAVGGFVYDHTGYTYQCRYNLVDRYGATDHAAELDDQDRYCVPGGPQILSTIGTNTSFRATALRAVGGFDEALMYYLDETDVCLRLIDAGYKVRIVPGALIYHRYAASFARTDRKMPTTLYPSAVCRAYYTYRNGLPGGDLSRVLDELAGFQTMLDRSNQWFVGNGWMTAEKGQQLTDEVRRGLKEGARLALTRRRGLITAEQAERLASPFRPFDRAAPRPAGGKLRVCLVTDGYPPENCGGVARWTADLAAGLVAQGHEAHVITLGSGHPTVTYEDGVWVHRVVPTWQPHHPVRLPVDVPGVPAAAMLAVYDEVTRASADAPFDVVAWHVWENLGLACLTDPALPCALFIESAFGLIRPFKPQWQPDTEYGREHVDKMVAAERYAYLTAPTVIAPSRTIVGEYDHLAGTPRTGRTVVIPLGTADPGEPARPERADGTVEVLYVGRLENRKGIDLLFAAIPDLCRRFPHVRFRIVGEDVCEAGEGSSPRARFEHAHAGASFWPQVSFTGRVSDDELKRAYAGCDVFVAPSRFESFGLIFIEAMAHGKPVVALAAGGATEIVRDGVDGFLVPPDDAAALAEALAKLIADHDLRAAASRQARLRYLQRFTIEKMASATAAVFQKDDDALDGLYPMDAPVTRTLRIAS